MSRAELGDRLVGSLAAIIIAAGAGWIGGEKAALASVQLVSCPERLEDGRSLIRTHIDASGALVGCGYQPRQSALLDYPPVELRRIANMRERMERTKERKP